jgi:tetratricopeptide (TPR) repeat protein
MEHEKYRDAEIFLLRVVKNAPEYSRAWADLVKAQREQDKFELAISSAEKLIQLDPKIAESYMVKASAEGMAGQNQAAIESYQTALKLAPNKAGAFCSMAHHLKTIANKMKQSLPIVRQSLLSLIILSPIGV